MKLGIFRKTSRLREGIWISIRTCWSDNSSINSLHLSRCYCSRIILCFEIKMKEKTTWFYGIFNKRKSKNMRNYWLRTESMYNGLTLALSMWSNVSWLSNLRQKLIPWVRMRLSFSGRNVINREEFSMLRWASNILPRDTRLLRWTIF